MSPTNLLDAMRTALAAVDGASKPGLRSASDAELTALLAAAANLRRAAERHGALIAGEIARRSSPELGLSGLVQRAGHRTVEDFLRSETGATGREAATTVRVGAIATAGGALADALHDGRVTVAAADAIHGGLGAPSSGVPPELLDRAAGHLIAESAAVDPDRLQKRARELRDELDAAGVADRERARRGARSLRLVRQPDGMSRLVWLLDPESAAVVTSIYDRATSPRRGGPRFVDPGQRERASRLADDERTTEQLASDAFTELLRAGATADQDVLLGGGEPSVRVLVNVEALTSASGHGVLESGESVSITSVQRLACAGGVLPVIIEKGAGQVLDFGPGATHLHPSTARCTRRARRRVHVARMRSSAFVDRGASHRAVGRRGPDRPRRWHPPLPAPPPPSARRESEDRATIRSVLGLVPPPASGRSPILLETKSRAVREMMAAG